MKNLTEIIEDIQQALGDAGGCFLRQEEIKKMTIQELIHLLLPNNVEIQIEHKPKSKVVKFEHLNKTATKEDISSLIEETLGYTNGWRIPDEDYKMHCDLIADKVINKTNDIPILRKCCNSKCQENVHKQDSVYCEFHASM